MIHTGRTQNLTVIRRTAKGVFLGDDQDNEVLLPNKERPDVCEVGQQLSVFVYRDEIGKPIASIKAPKVQVGEFAQLQVVSVDAAGAIVDWGLASGLFIPREEQLRKLEEGRWYVLRVVFDEEKDQLFGSTRIQHYLDNTDLVVAKGDEVSLMVFDRSPLGASVVVNDTHEGLVHTNEIFRPISIGDRVTGFVKTIREDNKLDITLQPIGYRKYNDVNTEMLAKRLQRGSGFLPLNDKSTPEEIHRELGISKKAFKQALGALYKDRKVRIEDAGIIWVAD